MQDREQQAPPTVGDDQHTTSVEAASTPLDPNFAADLEKQLGDALGEAAKLKDALLRAVADSDNMRKRAQADISNAHKFALENFSGELLAVKDSLEAALVIENATLESYRNGVELTLKQLNAAFEKGKVTSLDPVGEKFDPAKHQAISMVEDDGEPNRVVTVLQKGYLIYERVLRPALVTVSKTRQASPAKAVANPE